MSELIISPTYRFPSYANVRTFAPIQDKQSPVIINSSSQLASVSMYSQSNMSKLPFIRYLNNSIETATAERNFATRPTHSHKRNHFISSVRRRLVCVRLFCAPCGLLCVCPPYQSFPRIYWLPFPRIYRTECVSRPDESIADRQTSAQQPTDRHRSAASIFVQIPRNPNQVQVSSNANTFHGIRTSLCLQICVELRETVEWNLFNIERKFDSFNIA